MCSALAWGVGLMGPHAAPALLGFNRRAGALSAGLRGPLANREWEWNMSDPRYSDSRRNDELRRYGVQGPDGSRILAVADSGSHRSRASDRWRYRTQLGLECS
jgi:hypothetical protein